MCSRERKQAGGSAIAHIPYATMVWDQDTQVPLNDITTPPSLSLYRDAMVGKPERSAGAQPGPEEDQQRSGNAATV